MHNNAPSKPIQQRPHGCCMQGMSAPDPTYHPTRCERVRARPPERGALCRCDSDARAVCVSSSVLRYPSPGRKGGEDNAPIGLRTRPSQSKGVRGLGKWIQGTKTDAKKWTCGESNSGPSACEATVLPTEPQAHGYKFGEGQIIMVLAAVAPFPPPMFDFLTSSSAGLLPARPCVGVSFSVCAL